MMRYLTNPMYLLVTVWTVAGVSYLSGVWVGLFPPVESITVLAVGLSLGAFALGYFTWSLFAQSSPVSPNVPIPAPRPLCSKRIVRFLSLCLVMGILAFLAGLYRVMVIADIFGTSFTYLLTHPTALRLRLVMYIDYSHSQINFVPMVLSLTSSFLAIGFVLLGVYLYIERRIVKYLYLMAFLAISLAIGLTNLSRKEVTVNILSLMLAYGVMYASSKDKSWRDAVLDLFLPLASVVFLFGVIESLLGKGSAYGYVDHVQGFLFSLYWYIAAPLAAFNDYLSTFDGPHYWGQHTFFPFYKWLLRLDLISGQQVHYFGEKTFLPFMANVYTYLHTFYADFGLVGVAVIPYALGWGASAVAPKAARSFAYLNLYVMLLAMIVFSFYNYFFSSNQMYFQVLFGFLFFEGQLNHSHPNREAK